jgi:hypothetical protein
MRRTTQNAATVRRSIGPVCIACDGHEPQVELHLPSERFVLQNVGGIQWRSHEDVQLFVSIGSLRYINMYCATWFGSNNSNLRQIHTKPVVNALRSGTG